MATLHVRKNGETKLSIPYTIGVFGLPTFQNRYLVSKESCAADGVDPKPLITRKPTEKTEKYYLRLGKNPDGNVLVDDAEECAARIADGEAKSIALHVGSPRSGDNRKWGSCECCDVVLPPGFGKLRFCGMDTGCMEHMDRDGWHVRCSDQNACAARVPAAHRARKIRSLRDQASHARSVALGALTYDADGWLSREDRQKSHDEGMAKSATLESQAVELEKINASA